MVNAVRGRNLNSTPNKNRFLNVVLNAFNVGRETSVMSDDRTPNELTSTKNVSNRIQRWTRFVVSEVVEESSPSSQSTTITMLSSSNASSLLSSMITPALSSTMTSPSVVSSISHIEHMSDEIADQTNKTDSANKSGFFLTLGACIDDIIFEHSIPRKGVSLYVIKKFLEEKYFYDSWHFRKAIRNYVVESLASGHLEQVSGRGASGSVRLSQRQRRKLQHDSTGVFKASNKSRSMQLVAKHNKTNSQLSLNLFNLTNIRLKQRLTTAKRKSKYIQTTETPTKSNSSSYEANVIVPSQVY